MSEILDSLVADGNSSFSRRARVKLQPRDRKGRWIPTGASLIASLKTDLGQIVKIHGKAIGGTATKKGEKNNIRMLAEPGLEKYGIKPNTVLEIDPGNGELESKVKLDRDYLAKKGIDPDLQHNLPEDLADQPQVLADMKPSTADKLDIELANGGLTDSEDKDFRAERDAEPLAKLEDVLPQLGKEEISALVDPSKAAEPKTFGEFFIEERSGATPNSKHSPEKKPGATMRRREAKYIGDYNPGYYWDNGDGTWSNWDPERDGAQPRDWSPWDAGSSENLIYFIDTTNTENIKPGRVFTKSRVTGDFEYDKGDGDIFYGQDENGDWVYGTKKKMRDSSGYIYWEDDVVTVAKNRDDARKKATAMVEKFEKDKYGIEPSSKKTQASSNTAADLMDKASKSKVSPAEIDASVLELNKGTSPAPKDGKLVGTRPADLEVGDVIEGKSGERRTIVGIRYSDGLDFTYVKIQDDNGNVVEIKLDNAGADVSKVLGAKGKVAKPAKPVTPSAPEADATDNVDVSTPEAQKPTAPATAPTPAPAPAAPAAPGGGGNNPPNFPPKDRIDDGKDIAHTPMTPEEVAAARAKKATPLLDANGVPQKYVDENGKLQDAQDPFSLMNALAEAYPDAKFSEDGLSLILVRKRDKDGRIFELRASNAGMKAVTFSMRWTDPNTGEYEELHHYDTRHSITALFTKTNGPDGLMERLDGKGKWAKLTHGSWKAGPDASLRERAKYFAYKGKLKSSADMAVSMAAGRTETYHGDVRNWARVRKSKILSTWGAFDEYMKDPTNPDNRDALYERLNKIFGSIPMTEGEHEKARLALREEFNRLYPELNSRTWGAIVTNASMYKSKGKAWDANPASRAVPHASKDRVNPLEVGMAVEYENNVGEKMVLRVTKLIKNTNATPKQSDDAFDYGDTVTVVDANGNSRVLNAVQLQILKDQNTSLTRYKANLSKEALTRRREEQGKVPVGGPSRMPGETTAVATPPAPVGPQEVSDFAEGDILPDKNGNPIGEIISVEPVTSKNGDPGFAFQVLTPEGDDVRVAFKAGTKLELKKA